MRKICARREQGKLVFYTEPQPNLAQNRRFCGNSSVGRAQPCQGWGREFESRFPLQFQPHFGGAIFVYIRLLCCFGVTVAPFRSESGLAAKFQKIGKKEGDFGGLFTLKGKVRYLATGIALPLDAWDDSGQHIIPTYPDADSLQMQITAKRIEIEKKIQSLELPKSTESYSLAFARDIFLFSYYVAGINFKDIATLRYSDIPYQRLELQRTRKCVIVFTFL